MSIKHMYIPALAATILLIAACRPDAAVPAESTATTEEASVYPDYRDITLPPNIAPLNLRVDDPQADASVAEVAGRGRRAVAAARADEPLRFDSLEWRRLLESSRGSDLTVTLYTRRKGKWLRHPA